MQFGRGKPSAGVFYDSDFRDMDSVLGISMFYGMQNKNDCRVALICMSRADLKSAGYLDLVNRFYHGPAAVFNQLQPIGMPADARPTPAPEPFVKTFDRKKADGTPAYVNQVKTVIETADPNTLYRNYLEAQYDQNCFFFLDGPATNLVAALDFRGVKELLAAKCKYLVVVNPELHSKSDLPAAKRLFKEWPTAIITAGAELGKALPFPGASIDKEFAAVPDHPVADAYRLWDPKHGDIPATAMAAALYAARPKENYFKISEPGVIEISNDGTPVFTASTQGKHQVLNPDPAQKDKVLKDFVELASAKPAPPIRFRPNADKDKDKEKAAEKDPAEKVIIPPKP